ncbi:flagellar hook-basal body complex protein [Calditerrivibrio nitroreducens]|uniref:Flagellar hook protein FlgE n=1 Tax=Calditerrivibrio nitroreducens (strain DSM 19672 / NBRC 101217 / Yu37-1) TaxID=768670 RepID=E4TK88_CALNY|nr:flagellar hook-basal body complex protein [Calditerrivibrio nitroreducens]ADR19364.1 fagellar hook-basal body protein [Calditerrivibrio nitroreducens DSM 19672]
MLRSLYSAVSGLSQHQKAMDVLGNNVSNVNTVGYKASRLTFKDLMSQTVSIGKAPSGNIGGINPLQIGLGTNVASVDNIFLQGTFQTTGVTTDLAIDGKGFFIVRGEQQTERYYTRAGNFSFDRQGYLVNPEGFRVQGWMTDLTTGQLLNNADITDIQMGAAQMTLAAKQTSEVTLAGNLDTKADPTILQYQPLLTTSNSNTPITSIFNANGLKLDLLDGEPVRIKAHATGITNMAGVYNSSDVSLGLDSATTVNVVLNGTTYSLNYGAADGTDTDNTFNTLQGFAEELQRIIRTVDNSATVTISGGKLSINRSSTDFTVNSFSGNPNFAAVLQNLVGTYSTITPSRNSGEIFYEKVITTGSDFKNLGELANQISTAISGNVSSGFSASYVDNTLDPNVGRLVYTNSPATTTGSNVITGFSIDKAYSGTIFESNAVTSNTIAQGATSTSNKFLRYAESTDLLTNLMTNSGQSLGLDNTSTIQMDARIGGNIPHGDGVSTLSASGSTIADLTKKLEDYLGLEAGSIKIENGKISVTGEKGIKNQIDYITLSAIGSGTYATFNEYMKYQTVQNASGGQLITSQTIYDSQGNPHTVNYEFYLYNEANNEWKLKLSPADTVNDSISIDGTTGDEVVVRFNPNGSFQGVYDANNGNIIPNLSYTLSPSNGADKISGVKVFIGKPGEFNGMVLSAGPSTITKSDQNGFQRGDLDKISINDVGEIVGSYSNGEIKILGQIAVAIFTNQEGLARVGSSLFSETPNSGLAAIGVAGAGGRGVIQSGAVENSNVDIAQEFVTMITVQRGYQTNSRVITTSDEMLQELLNLKR